MDGFRFDLASALARELHDVDRLSAFFDLVQQDPVVSQVKLIAEPWDVGEGGYQVGNFPPLWSEWNGKYRDTVRDFWRGRALDPARVRLPAVRLQRPLRDQRAPAGRLHQLRHLPRRLHPRRPGLLRPQAQRGQRRGQRRRHRRQPVVELRGRGADRGPGRARAAGPAAAQLPRHAVLLAGGADAAGRRRAGPHAGRQQQRLLPGQRGVLGGLEPGRQPGGPAGVRVRAGRVPPRPPGLPPPPVLPRAARDGGDGLADIAWLTPSGREMAGRGLGHPLRARDDGVPQRRRHHRARPARRAGARRHLPDPAQRRPASRSRSRCPGRSSAAAGPSRSTRAAGRAGRGQRGRAPARRADRAGRARDDGAAPDGSRPGAPTARAELSRPCGRSTRNQPPWPTASSPPGTATRTRAAAPRAGCARTW